MSMNIPNLLTVARVLLVPGMVICLVNNNFQAAFIIFVVAGATDGLDGMVAKLFNQATELGAFIDPVADKLLIDTASLTLAIQGVFPVWLAVLIVSRDLIILLGMGVLMHTGKDFVIRPHLDSKITTVAQLATIAFFLGEEIFHLPSLWGEYLIMATALCTVFSGIRYIIVGLRIIEE